MRDAGDDFALKGELLLQLLEALGEMYWRGGGPNITQRGREQFRIADVHDELPQQWLNLRTEPVRRHRTDNVFPQFLLARGEISWRLGATGAWELRDDCELGGGVSWQGLSLREVERMSGRCGRSTA